MSYILNHTRQLLLLVFFTGVIISCDDKDEPGDVIPGNINLEVHAIHHTWDVPYINVYLRMNATEFPGPDSSLYNFSGVTDGYGKYTFTKLYQGNYFIYATGFDSLVNDTVFGQLPVTLKYENVTDNLIKVNINVTE